MWKCVLVPPSFLPIPSHRPRCGGEENNGDHFSKNCGAARNSGPRQLRSWGQQGARRERKRRVFLPAAAWACPSTTAAPDSSSRDSRSAWSGSSLVTSRTTIENILCKKIFFFDSLYFLFYIYAHMQSFICQYSFPVILKTVLRLTSPWCSAVSTTSGWRRTWRRTRSAGRSSPATSRSPRCSRAALLASHKSVEKYGSSYRHHQVTVYQAGGGEADNYLVLLL